MQVTNQVQNKQNSSLCLSTAYLSVDLFVFLSVFFCLCLSLSFCLSVYLSPSSLSLSLSDLRAKPSGAETAQGRCWAHPEPPVAQKSKGTQSDLSALSV